MATWQHLRSSTVHKRPTTSLADGRIAINTNGTSPGLFFKDSAGTGIVKVGPVHVGTTAPNASPAVGGSSGNYTGEQWLDTSVAPAQLKVWNGSAWVGIVADELPVSKLQDGAAGQIVQTDSAGTGVEWSSTTNLPLGSAAAPAYSFQGDPNTGLYSPGADQLAISTGGTGRLFVDSSGNVGVGASPVVTFAGQTHLTVNHSAGGTTVAGLNLATDGIRRASLITYPGNSEALRITAESATLPITFHTNSSERARITSDGKVGIGSTSDPGAYGSKFWVDHTADTGITINTTGSTSRTQIVFRNANVNGEARIYNSTGGPLTIYKNSSEEAVRIDSSGRLLVGTSSSPGAGELLRVEKATTGTEGAGIRFGGTYTIADNGTQTFTIGNSALVFVSNNTTGNGALFFCSLGSATISLLSDPDGVYATSVTAGKVSLTKTASSATITLTNKSGASRSFTIGKINNSD